MATAKARAIDARDRRVAEVMAGLSGRAVGAREVAEICGITMMGAAWSLKRLYLAGDVIRQAGSEPCSSRQSEIVTRYTHAPDLGSIATDLPAWMLCTTLPPYIKRRTVRGSAGMLDHDFHWNP